MSMDKAKPLVVLLMGPTASGKTDLAMRIADHLPSSLISVDSALIYKGMDIGTAKPSPEVLSAYPHRLVDIIDPAESYSAATFRDDALACIEDAVSNQRLPILVGGTMMYFNALIKGMASLPDADPVLRTALETRIQQDGIESLHAQLALLDPVAAERLHPSDSQRVQRALEVCLLSGQSMTSLWAQQGKVELPFRYLSLALMPQDRSILHKRIEQRFDKMLEQGFETEVRSLFDRQDLHPGMPSIRAVGYRQMWQYLDGELGYKDMREKSIVATRQLAKRQYTWLRSWEDLQILEGANENILPNALKLIQQAII